MDELRILNLALTALGEDLIVDPLDQAKRARHAHAAFPRVRDEMLARKPWRSARRRFQLSADSTKPLFGYDNQFTLPGEIVEVFDLPDDPGVRWEREGGRLLADASGPLNVLATIRLDDTSQIDPLLGRAIGLQIAVDIGPAIAANDTRVANCARMLDEALGTGATRSAQQGQVEVPDADRWLAARV